MFAFVLNMLIICVIIKVIFKFMYPKPPKAFLPSDGDDTTVRACHFCGHSLATYRGILEKNGETDERFFCNDQHKQAFDAGERYQP